MAQKKEKEIASFACPKEMQDFLDDYVVKNNTNKSKLIRGLITTYVIEAKKTIQVERDDDHFPIVLQIPKNITSDQDALKKWLMLRVNAIVAKLSAPPQ